MVSLYKQDGETLYGIKEFLLDSVEDLTDIPIAKLKPGSSALIIPTGELYIFSGNKEWQVLGGKTITENPDAILSKFDIDNDGIIDRSEESDSFTMYDM